MSIIEKLGIIPGPWGSAHRKNGKTLESGESLYSTEIFQKENSCDKIATIEWCGVETKRGYTSLRNSTAQLIAAAPDLLKFLIYLHEYSRESCSSDYEYVEKTIEKATGKTWEEIKGLIK